MPALAENTSNQTFDPNKPQVDIEATTSNGKSAKSRQTLEVPLGGHITLIARAYGGKKEIKKIFFILTEEGPEGAIRLYEVEPKNFAKHTSDSDPSDGTAFVRMPTPKRLNADLTLKVTSLIVTEGGIQQDSWPMYLKFKK